MRNGDATKGGSQAATRVERRTVDLSAYPDLVVIYLGMNEQNFYGE